MGWRNEEPISRWVTRRAGPPDAGISTRRVPDRLGRRMLRIWPLRSTRASSRERHDPGLSPEPYVPGTLLAVRRVAKVTGVRRGLDLLLFGDDDRSQ